MSINYVSTTAEEYLVVSQEFAKYFKEKFEQIYEEEKDNSDYQDERLSIDITYIKEDSNKHAQVYLYSDCYCIVDIPDKIIELIASLIREAKDDYIVLSNSEGSAIAITSDGHLIDFDTISYHIINVASKIIKEDAKYIWSYIKDRGYKVDTSDQFKNAICGYYFLHSKKLISLSFFSINYIPWIVLLNVYKEEIKNIK